VEVWSQRLVVNNVVQDVVVAGATAILPGYTPFYFEGYIFPTQGGPNSNRVAFNLYKRNNSMDHTSGTHPPSPNGWDVVGQPLGYVVVPD
jgi:hypothetical protein